MKFLNRSLAALAALAVLAACTQDNPAKKETPLTEPPKVNLSGSPVPPPPTGVVVERFPVTVDVLPDGTCDWNQVAERGPSFNAIKKKYARSDDVVEYVMGFERDGTSCSGNVTVEKLAEPFVRRLVKEETFTGYSPNDPKVVRRQRWIDSTTKANGLPEGPPRLPAGAPKPNDHKLWHPMAQENNPSEAATEVPDYSGPTVAHFSYVSNRRGNRSWRREADRMVMAARHASAPKAATFMAMSPLTASTCKDLAEGFSGEHYHWTTSQGIRSFATLRVSDTSFIGGTSPLMEHKFTPYFSRYHNYAQFGGSCIVIDSIKVQLFAYNAVPTAGPYPDTHVTLYDTASRTATDRHRWPVVAPNTAHGADSTETWPTFEFFASSDGTGSGTTPVSFYLQGTEAWCSGFCPPYGYVTMRAGVFTKLFRECTATTNGNPPGNFWSGHEIYRFSYMNDYDPNYPTWSSLHHVYTDSNWSYENGYVGTGGWGAGYGYPGFALPFQSCERANEPNLTAYRDVNLSYYVIIQ